MERIGAHAVTGGEVGKDSDKLLAITGHRLDDFKGLFQRGPSTVELQLEALPEKIIILALIFVARRHRAESIDGVEADEPSVASQFERFSQILCQGKRHVFAPLTRKWITVANIVRQNEL